MYVYPTQINISVIVCLQVIVLLLLTNSQHSVLLNLTPIPYGITFGCEKKNLRSKLVLYVISYVKTLHTKLN